MVPAVAQSAARAVVEGDPDTVRLFVASLPLGVDKALAHVSDRRATSTDPHTLAVLRELVAEARRAAITPGDLAVVLGASLLTRAGLSSSGEASLVWTGPEVHESAFRETAAVITELIDTSASQVLVVTYTLRPDSFDPEATTLARLAIARRRGVGVTVVAHKSDANKLALLDAWPSSVPLPRLLTWPIPDGDEMVKLHAKIMCIDDRSVLITSANLTYHGLFSNLELGILVHGGVASEVRRHFDRLERLGHLTEWA